jgi:PAS domain S-box-containing protein
MLAEQPVDQHVLLLAPTSRDGEATASVLASAGIQCRVCSSLDALCYLAEKGAAAVIIPEELMLTNDADQLTDLLRRQPVWSDLPVIVLTSSGVESIAVERAIKMLGNVSLIERPMRISTLVSVVRSALRARNHQYQVRGYLLQSEQTRQRLARDALLLSHVQDSVIVTDLDGIVIFWNEGAKRLLGYDSTEMVGKFYADRLPEPARSQVTDWIKKIAVEGQEFQGQWLETRKDGSTVWIEATTRRIADAAGKPVGIMGVSRDITERAKLLEAERTARMEAERSSRMKDEFLATLSHELRTPLNAILGWSQILATGDNDPEEISEGLRTIERNARAQTQIIEDLLDMSRIISGKVRLDVQPMDLTSVIRQATDTVRPAADARGICMQLELDPSVGPMTGDPSRLQQVMWNLLNNAIKFTPRGGQVQVTLRRADAQVQIDISDTGEGIKPDFLPHVFDRFRQADATTTRRHGGLGLGLAIVKQLVELHGGSIKAASAGIGKGTTFTVTLPIAVLAPEPPVDLPRRPPVVVSGAKAKLEIGTALNGVKVLVVDDEPDARALVKRLLEDCNAIVTTAAGAAEALDAFRAHPPDVLVSDIGMPSEDGYSLIQKIRALQPTQGRNVPALALTAYARSEDRMQSARCGFQNHIAKPVEPAELITMVATLARRI